MKKIVIIVSVMVVTFGMSTVVSASTWNSYFGLNKGWYEGAKGKLTKNSGSSWTAQVQSIGWGGCWGGQVFKNAKIIKGKKYTVKFKIKSTRLKKYVYFKISNTNGSKMNLGKWIDCKKGKTIKYKKTFKAKYNSNEVYFGFGGDFGDRASVKTDKDAKVRYKLAPNKKLDSRLGPDAAAGRPTEIVCSSFSLKAIGKNKSKATPKLNKKKVTIKKGKTVKLKVLNTKKRVKWSSTKKSVASVNKKGVVKGKKTGKATIIAKVKGKKYKCKVTVKKAKKKSKKKKSKNATEVLDEYLDLFFKTYGKPYNDSEYGNSYYICDEDKDKEMKTEVIYGMKSNKVKVIFQYGESQKVKVYFGNVYDLRAKMYWTMGDLYIKGTIDKCNYKSLKDHHGIISEEDNLTMFPELYKQVADSTVRLAVTNFDLIFAKRYSKVDSSYWAFTEK